MFLPYVINIINILKKRLNTETIHALLEANKANIDHYENKELVLQ